MAGLFIDIKLGPGVQEDAELAKKLEEVCPVSIFSAGPQGLTLNDENLDECTLCDLCLEAAPGGGVEIIKLYES